MIIGTERWHGVGRVGTDGEGRCGKNGDGRGGKNDDGRDDKNDHGSDAGAGAAPRMAQERPREQCGRGANIGDRHHDTKGAGGVERMVTEHLGRKGGMPCAVVCPTVMITAVNEDSNSFFTPVLFFVLFWWGSGWEGVRTAVAPRRILSAYADLRVTLLFFIF